MNYTLAAIITLWTIATVFLAMLAHKYWQSTKRLAELKSSNARLLKYTLELEKRKKRDGDA